MSFSSWVIFFCFSQSVIAFQIGQGYDSSEKELRGNCFSEHKDYYGSSNFDMQSFFEELRFEELTEASTHQKAGIGGSFLGASAKLHVSAKDEEYRHQFSILYKADFEDSLELLREYELSEIGKKALESVPLRYQNKYWLWQGFRDLCGDSLVTEISRGFHLLLKIGVYSTKAMRNIEIQKTITVKILFGKKKIRSKKTYTSFHEDDLVFIEFLRNGEDLPFKKALCSYKEAESCADFLEETLALMESYAEASVLSFQTRKYKDLGVSFYDFF